MAESLFSDVSFIHSLINGGLSLLFVFIGVALRRELKKRDDSAAELKKLEEVAQNDFKEQLKERFTKLETLQDKLFVLADACKEDRRNICLQIAEMRGEYKSLYKIFEILRPGGGQGG